MDFGTRVGIATGSGSTSWSVTSDRRLKSDIAPLEGALDRLLKLSGVTFRYTDPSPMRPAGTHIGFVAQEVQQVFPHWVNTDKDGYLSVGPQGFEALTVDALRELRVEKDVEIAALKARNDALQARLDALEATVSRLTERER